MAKKIRFPLQMKNGVEVRTLEELRENFDLESILGYYENGKLVTWLRDRYYDLQAQQIKALASSTVDLNKKICEILGVDYVVEEAETNLEVIKHRNERIVELLQYTNDNKLIKEIDSIALNQEDLLDFLDEGKKRIYLCHGEFEIPLSASNVEYIGVANPTVIIRAVDNIGLKKINITFSNTYYGWDVSNVTSNDVVKRAEEYILSKKYQSAIDILEKVVNQGNPRVAMLLFNLYSEFILNKSKADYYFELMKESRDVFSLVQNESEKVSGCLPLLQKMAKTGNAINEYYYAYALYIVKNYDKSIEWYEKSATHGFPLAQGRLADFYFYGEVVCKDFETAVNWYKMAALKEHPNSQMTLGHCYENGIGLSKNDKKAFSWYKKAAELGDATAQYNLGAYYQNGICCVKSLNKAIEWFEKSAEQGDKWAQFSLGEYYFAEGEKQNYCKAVEWFEKSAEQGYASAQNALGHCYMDGIGVIQNYTEAIKWFRKAAEQGNVSAQNNLGVCYMNGEGVTQDLVEAVKWFKKAAEQGDITAQDNLGYCYMYGEGIRQNSVEAIKWFRKAAEQGNASAQNNLANCYYRGTGVATNYNEAIKWFTKAAEQGNASAQNNLGVCYMNGEGTPYNYTQAIKWFRRAAEQGNVTAQNELNNLGERW